MNFATTTPELCTTEKMENIEFMYGYVVEKDCNDYTAEKSPSTLGDSEPQEMP